MFALPPKADIRGRGRNVRFVPIADIAALFDNLIGTQRETSGDGIVDRFGRL
jgi:hypothetical protein